MNRKISLGIAISLMAIAVTMAITFTYTIAMNTFESRMSAVTERQTTNNLLTEIDNKIRQKYNGAISEKTLREGIASGYIDGLSDEYCVYFSADEWELETSRQAGYDFGLGMTVTRAGTGNILVQRVAAGSPAAKAGIKSGDIITYVNSGDDNRTVLSRGYENSVKILSSATNTISVTYSNGDGDAAAKLTRTQYPINSVEYKTIDSIGFIRIHEFVSTTSDQFNSAVSALQRADVSGIIIDLRGSGGGSFKSACDVLDTLLPACRLMIFNDKSGESKVMYQSDKDSINLPMCVLINGGTRGASELFASAMYDCSCELIGEETYGQMVVQEDFELSDGSSLRLPTGTWSTTLGKAISNGRVVPSFAVELSSYQKENMYKLDPRSDPQITTAVSIIETAAESGQYGPTAPGETSSSDE